MKNNNGFISISIVYSFFLVFTLLLILIMSTYVNNRLSFSTYKTDIKNRVYSDSNKIDTTAPSNLNEYCKIHKEENLLSCWLYNNKSYFLKETTVDNTHYAYRFVGPSPTNYVCFGNNSDCFNVPAGTLPINVPSATLQLENLQYRVVGIFDGYYLGKTEGRYYVKLVRNFPIGQTNVDGVPKWGSNNTWNGSTLKNYLTITNIGLNLYTSQIDNSTWYTCYNNKTRNRNIFWMYESANSCTTLVNSQIGLLYASDYGYSANDIGDYKTITGSTIFKASNTWLFVKNEWLLSKANTSTTVWGLNDSGTITAYTASSANAKNYVRPVVYLKDTMKYRDGTGLSASDGITFGA